MAKSGFSAARAAEVLGSGRAAMLGRDERLAVQVVVDPSCQRELVLAAKELLVPERPGGRVCVCGLEDALSFRETPDLVVILGGSTGAGVAAAAFARSGVPVAIVVEGALDAPTLNLPEGAAALVRTVACSSASSLGDALAAWMASVTDKAIALAANFAFCRPAVVGSLISRCAAENALVGAVGLVPGSDLPIMSANQAKLALDIAAAHGRGLEPSRALEIAGVLFAGIGWRSVARAVLGLVPGLGVVLRAGIGYAGTVAAGNALQLRFEGAPKLEFAGASAPREGAVPQCAPTVALPAAPAGDGYVIIEEVRS